MLWQDESYEDPELMQPAGGAGAGFVFEPGPVTTPTVPLVPWVTQGTELEESGIPRRERGVTQAELTRARAAQALTARREREREIARQRAWAAQYEAQQRAAKAQAEDLKRVRAEQARRLQEQNRWEEARALEESTEREAQALMSKVLKDAREEHQRMEAREAQRIRSAQARGMVPVTDLQRTPVREPVKVVQMGGAFGQVADVGRALAEQLMDKIHGIENAEASREAALASVRVAQDAPRPRPTPPPSWGEPPQHFAEWWREDTISLLRKQIAALGGKP